jgi:hypothetical protein
MRRSLVSLALLSLLGSAAAGQSGTVNQTQIIEENPLLGRTIGLDHVLLWVRDRAAGEDFLRDKLGFTLGPSGSYTHGIRHNIIRFSNRSFIEFLWLSDPAAAREKAPWAYNFATTHDGSNAFGIQVESIDKTFEALSKGGLKPEQPMAEALDPDGPEGPKPPIVNEWRFMFLGEGAAAGDPFFVQYTPKKAPVPPPPHPNGAVQLTSVWVAVGNLETAKDAYLRAGFPPVRPINMPRLNASGTAFAARDGEIILLAADGAGLLKDRLSARGDHVVGMSIRVEDTKATARVLKERLGPQKLSMVDKDAMLVDATQDLGFFFEFRQ